MQIYQGEHLGTILNLKIDTSEPCDEVFLEMREKIIDFENRFSRFIPGNHLDTINKNGGGILDQDGIIMLQYALKIAHQSNGIFDPTVLPYLRKIGYDYHQRGENTHQTVGYQYIHLIGNQLTLNNHIEIEFGGIGKGYLIDQITQLLREKYYERFLVDFGGDIWAEGTGWQVGLEDPCDTERILNVITLSNSALAASSRSKRYFGRNHHLIDPRTGASSYTNHGSFVLATSAMIADVHATLFCIMNTEERGEYLRKYGENMDVYITE
ncbi:MAG: FAD:protein FMN transferase [Candidatus Gracilibacteria bacterium]